MYMNPRWKQAPLQFRLLLLTSGAMAGWMMVLIAVLIMFVMARPAS
jgi:hypothetical protein